MTIDSTVFDFSQTNANALLRLFRAHAPITAAEAVAPFLVRLFSALEDGNSFIWMSWRKIWLYGQRNIPRPSGTDCCWLNHQAILPNQKSQIQ